jgi:hypothetical protein
MGMPRAISIKNIGEDKPVEEVKREVVQHEMSHRFVKKS